MKIFKKIFQNIFVINFGLAILILAILTGGVLWWLNIYTHHGEAVVVPDVKGLQEKDAAPFFQRVELRYEIVDSMYVKNAKPGSIIEVTPPAGSKVKADRIIFIKINSFLVETFILPELKDLSQRQALAMLKVAGFENVRVKQVPSPYKDLVLGIEYNGREINAGERLPAASSLVLKVSSGEFNEDDSDSLNNPENNELIEDNSWF